MTIRDISTQFPTEAAEPHRFERRTASGGIAVEDVSGIAYAEATGRTGLVTPPATTRGRYPWVLMALAAVAIGAGWAAFRRPAAQF